ncbi:MAG: hypothetical protein JXB06_05245 [Spirochaetales bacterium]|nr:hypothetical protein [Spirochaetales bacterium]
MRTLGIGLVAALLLVAMPLWTQATSDEPEFLGELRGMLEKEDWSPEEIREIVEQDADWSRAAPGDAGIVALCLQYARSRGGIGPEDSAERTEPQARIRVRIAEAVMEMSGEMRRLGFDEPRILRAALSGTREALDELSGLKQREGSQADMDGGAGELIRSRFRQELHSAMNLQARHRVETRVREEKQSRPADLLVPPGPQGPGGPRR